MGMSDVLTLVSQAFLPVLAISVLSASEGRHRNYHVGGPPSGRPAEYQAQARMPVPPKTRQTAPAGPAVPPVADLVAFARPGACSRRGRIRSRGRGAGPSRGHTGTSASPGAEAGRRNRP